MDIYFTSDTHFYHKNIIKYCNRPFKSLEEMNETMIRKWNERVKKDDLVFHLGDLCFKYAPSETPDAPKNAYEIIKSKLNGTIILIKGNHDGARNGSKTIIQNIVIEYAGDRIFLTHNPEFCNVNFKLNLVGHCVTPDTEILTLNGWKKYSEVNLETFIATYNIKKRKVEYQKPYNINIFNYNGKMYNFKSDKIDLITTPDHSNVVLSNRRAKINGIKTILKPSYDISDDSFLLNTLKWDYPMLYKLKNAYWAELMGFIIGDGNYEIKNKNIAIRIRQKEGIKTKYLKSLLRKCGLIYTKTKEKKYPRFRISNYNIRNIEFINTLLFLCPEKILTRNIISLPKIQLNLLYRGLIMSDGHYYNSNNQSFYQKNYKCIELFEELCLRLGLRFHTFKRKQSCGFKPGSINYYVNITKNRIAYINNRNIQKINYKGIVWCPTVENGTWIAKRNGKVCITGNCHNAWKFKRYRKGESFTDCCNVGVDVWNFYPITINEIMSEYSKWKRSHV